MRCNTCRGTGRDPLSDNANWLPCPQCGGTGEDRRPTLECVNCGERFDPAIPQHFPKLQLCLACQQEHQLRESAPLLLAALRQISQASIGITPTRELLIICMQTASQAVAMATTLPPIAPSGTYYTPPGIIEPAAGSGDYLNVISANPPYSAA